MYYILFLKKNLEISVQNGPEHETTYLKEKFSIEDSTFLHCRILE